LTRSAGAEDGDGELRQRRVFLRVHCAAGKGGRLRLVHNAATQEDRMAGDRSDIVAIMAAIIFAGRTGETAQPPHDKDFGAIAKAAWDLHKAVVAADEVQVARAGFRQT
jgi:hypothetical protein